MRCAIVIAIVVVLPIFVVHVSVVVVVVVVCCSCPRATEVYRGNDLACGCGCEESVAKQRNSRGIICE